MTKLEAGVLWEVKERDPVSGLWLPKNARYNLVTNYGLTAFSSAPSGGYTAPIYMVIDNASTTISATISSGSTSVALAADPTVGGDTQLVLGLGLGGQETVTFNAKTGTGPVVFTLTAPTVNSHTAGDPACRAPAFTDTIASVLSESQFDPTYSPSLRLPQTAFFSPGSGQNTMQFFFAGTQATNLYFVHVGLADSPTINSGNLHNYAALGYNHTNTNDVEIDVTWTVTTS